MKFHSMIIGAFGALAMQFYGLPADAQALEPYQAMAAIGNSTTCPNRQCILEFPPVPAGKRLVLTSVSAQLGPAADQLVLEGNGVSYFVPLSHPDLGYLSAPVTLYFDAMTKPTARIFAPNLTQATSLIVTLVGHLLDREQPE
ncbi:hypothetical protein [Geminicoccus flavidas]|uniref:hypothetical protein n=1 Tax=Geminicoccus flavidas TaxID=2506407 RepID=UPI00135A5E53|nr:hypothetical protein [Geminicoccus flavidas]